MKRSIVASCWLSASLLFASTALAAPTQRPSTNPTKKSLALISLTRGEGFTEREAATIEGVLLTALDQTGRFNIVGRSDIDALLSLEAKKQAVNCNADTNCAVQIAQALGVEYVATASVGRLGKNTIVALVVIDVTRATAVARVQQNVASDDALPDAAQILASDAVRQIWPPLPTATATAKATWAMFAVAGVAAITAGVAGGLTSGCSKVTNPAERSGVVPCATNAATSADVAWGIAGASAVTGGGLLLTWLPQGTSSEASGKVTLGAAPFGLFVRASF